MEEETQQRITYLLQEIDANICAAHRSATQICSTVRRHHQILRQIHDATQAWKPLFESFSHQPVVRRPPPTPSARLRLTPSSNSAKKRQRRRAYSDESDDYDNDNVNEYVDSPVADEQQFKTTTLVDIRRHDRSANDTLNMSIASDNLPQMARTSYIPTPSHTTTQGGGGDGAQHDVSSINTEERSMWSPAMSSPIRTGVMQSNQRHAGGGRSVPTPDSVISSVAPTSPISKNLMKIGAFEFTPPRRKSSSAMLTQRRATLQDVDEEIDDDDDESKTPATPEIPAFATRASFAPQSPVRSHDARAVETPPSTRKRQRVGSSSSSSSSATTTSTAAYPKTFYPASPLTASPGSRFAVSPRRRAASPGKPFASLRRKFSSTGDYLTPTKMRKVESHASIAASATRASEQLGVDDDEPRTPPLDLASPLLRTQLKAMTPHTPLSNRLVGANLDIGSLSHEAKLQDYDDSFNAEEPTPQFQVAMFPAAFQHGVGAVQISTLYSKFQGVDNARLPTFSVDQLVEKLPDFGKEKIEVLLDTLVSRRLLRPFVVEGTMFWQIPA